MLKPACAGIMPALQSLYHKSFSCTGGAGGERQWFFSDSRTFSAGDRPPVFPPRRPSGREQFLVFSAFSAAFKDTPARLGYDYFYSEALFYLLIFSIPGFFLPEFSMPVPASSPAHTCILSFWLSPDFFLPAGSLSAACALMPSSLPEALSLQMAGVPALSCPSQQPVRFLLPSFR